MSSSGDDENGQGGFRRILRESKEQAFHARRQLRHELPSPSGETKRQVAEALSNYRDILWDYHDETALKTPWDEREVNVDAVDRLLSETVEHEKSLNRRGSPTTTERVPAAYAVDAHTLIMIGKELDAIAKELGFAAKADQQLPMASDMPDQLPDHIKENAPAFKQARTDGGEDR